MWQTRSNNQGIMNKSRRNRFQKLILSRTPYWPTMYKPIVWDCHRFRQFRQEQVLVYSPGSALVIFETVQPDLKTAAFCLAPHLCLPVYNLTRLGSIQEVTAQRCDKAALLTSRGPARPPCEKEQYMK